MSLWLAFMRVYGETQTVHSTFVCNSKKLETAQMSFNRSTLNKLWHICITECGSKEKGTTTTTRQLESISEEMYWVKKATFTKWHVIWFRLRNIFEMKKMRGCGVYQGLKGWEEREMGWGWQKKWVWCAERERGREMWILII